MIISHLMYAFYTVSSILHHHETEIASSVYGSLLLSGFSKSPPHHHSQGGSMEKCSRNRERNITIMKDAFNLETETRLI